MIPLTVNPTVVLKQDMLGGIVAVATNIAPDLKVVIAHGDQEFDYEAANKPFVNRTADNVKPSDCPDLPGKYLPDYLRKSSDASDSDAVYFKTLDYLPEYLRKRKY